MLRTQLLALPVLLTLGCTGESIGTVKGTLNIDGQATGGYEIHYLNASDGSMAIGYAQADGRYEMFRGRGKSTLNTGSYTVSLSPSPDVPGVPMPKLKLPAIYTDRDQAALKVTVNPGENDITLDVKSR